MQLLWCVICVEEPQQYYKHGCDKRHHWKQLEQCLCLLFSHNLALFLYFFALQYKHNIRTLSVLINLYSLWNRSVNLAKESLICDFQKVVQIMFIFSEHVHILYIYSAISISNVLSITPAIIPFALHELGTRTKAVYLSVTKYIKPLSIQCNRLIYIESIG